MFSAYSGAIESAHFECKQFGTMKYNTRVPDLNHSITLALSFLLGGCLPEYMCSVHERGGE